MANEAINTKGSFATIQAASSTGDGAFSSGTRTTITAALTTGSEDLYSLLDLQLAVSSGTPTENGTVDVYRRPKADGTNEAPAPAGSYAHEYVGSFVMDNTASSYFYLFGVANVDENATYYLYNNDGASTLTIALAARGRTLEPAA